MIRQVTVDQLEPGDWFRDPWEERLLYVDDVQEHGDEIHVFYTAGEDDASEPAEAIYDQSAVVIVSDEIAVE